MTNEDIIGILITLLMISIGVAVFIIADVQRELKKYKQPRDAKGRFIKR